MFWSHTESENNTQPAGEKEKRKCSSWQESQGTHVAYCYLCLAAWRVGRSYHLILFTAPTKPSNTGDMNQLLTLKCDLSVWNNRYLKIIHLALYFLKLFPIHYLVWCYIVLWSRQESLITNRRRNSNSEGEMTYWGWPQGLWQRQGLESDLPNFYPYTFSSLLSYKWWYAGKCLTSSIQETTTTTTSNVAFANFYVVNTPSVANFKLST